jgi:hypothetical protein
MKTERITLYRLFSILCLLLVVATTTVSAEPDTPQADPLPRVLTYQGLLIDKVTSEPITGQVDITFTLYDAPAAVSGVWTQIMQDVQVTEGQFTVRLGGNPAPFPVGTFAGGNLYLGVQVGTDAEMTPRTRLSSVPFAQTAETLRANGTTTDNSSSATYTFEQQGYLGHALDVIGTLWVEGDTHVEGTLSWEARTGRIVVPACAFLPQTDGYEYSIGGTHLITNLGTKYFAPAHLPDHSTVTGMTFHFYDDTASGGINMKLQRFDYSAQLVGNIAEIDSTDGGYGSADASSIMNASVDLEYYNYYLEADFSELGTDLQLKAVVIEYEFTKPY